MMKTIFDASARNELLDRIKLINENSQSHWGKMNVLQMVKHSAIWNEWVQGTHKPVYKQELLGRIFGKMALKSTVGNDKPMKKNVPAGALAVKDNEGNFKILKDRWIELVADYSNFSNTTFIHDFFGKMTREEIGILVYKHTDHHLRQFGI